MVHIPDVLLEVPLWFKSFFKTGVLRNLGAKIYVKEVGIGTSRPGSLLEVVDVITANGMAFPATQVASSNANTLDDYEEGSWTPTASYVSGNGDLSYDQQTGRYTKVGNVVFAHIEVKWDETTASGALSILGWPFTTANIANLAHSTAFIAFNLSGTVGSIIMQMEENSVIAKVYEQQTGSATQLTDSETSANALFKGTLVYQV